MSWTYFTSYLDGTRPILKAERDELYTQLAAKFTDCAVQFSLNSTPQSQITGSNLITDLASLHNAADSSDTLARLESIISAAAIGFSNYSSARSSALSTAGISSGDLSAILASNLDDVRLWNYYRALIDGLTPATAPSATLVKRTSSASLTKCGYDEYSGYESSPPKIYRTRTLSGYLRDRIWLGVFTCESCLNSNRVDFSGSCTYSRPDCTLTEGGNAAISGSNLDCDEAFVENQTTCEIGSFEASLAGVSPTVTYSATQKRVHGDTTCYDIGGGQFENSDGEAVEDLSDEYTTSDLNSDVDSALAAFSGSFSAGTPSSTYDISSDERTISKSKNEYKFTLPSLSPGQCYKLAWIERFTPEGGGSPTDTAKSYLWNGSDTETPVYTINVPGSQGTTTVVSVVASCDCS